MLASLFKSFGNLFEACRLGDSIGSSSFSWFCRCHSVIVNVASCFWFVDHYALPNWGVFTSNSQNKHPCKSPIRM